MNANRLEIQQTQKLSQSLQTVIHLLSFDLDGLSDFINKAVQENPALEVIPPKKAEEATISVHTRYRGGVTDREDTLQTAAPVSQMDELVQQLRLSSIPTDVLHTALAMLPLLSSRGYFTHDLREFAQDAGVTEKTALQALGAIQSLQPAGVGARSIGECLQLQLNARGETDELCSTLVERYLTQIGRGQLQQIARQTGESLSHVKRCVQIIRSLNPIPCLLYQEETQHVQIEFEVEADENGELAIRFYNDYYPSLRQSADFDRLAEGLQGEGKAFVRQMQLSASQLIRAIEMRQTTMEKLARIIVREQKAFFIESYSLLPLNVADVAAQIGVHETTIYRAVSGKSLRCSRGVFPLTHFFQKEVSGGTSKARVKEMIEEMCQDGEKLSDRQIAEMLEERGISISRRTVAKYRSQLKIDSSFYRRTEEGE